MCDISRIISCRSKQGKEFFGPQVVSATVPGTRTFRQFQENAVASKRSGLPLDFPAKIDKVRARWEQESGDLIGVRDSTSYGLQSRATSNVTFLVQRWE